MGRRIREARNVLNISVSEMARVTGVSEQEYLDHESGMVDSSFTFILRCAQRFNVDINALVSGALPMLSRYTITRAGGGTTIKRSEDFEYRHLGALMKNRAVDPFVVTFPPYPDDSDVELATHAGQEFDYILSGRLKARFDDSVEYLGPGDSVLYDSSRPHGMIGVGSEPCVFIAVVVNGEKDGWTHPEPKRAFVRHAAAQVQDKLVCHRFMDETLDADGRLESVKFHIPDDFNFSYDVLDVLAAEQGDRLALAYVGRDHRRRDFTFREMSEESKRTAAYLSSLGIGRGDHVMLVMKRHYQFWFAITALHRIGAVAVPASNQLQSKDYAYRFRHGDIKAIIASGDGEIAQAVDDALPQCPGMKIRIMVNGRRDGWRDFDGERAGFPAEFERPKNMKSTDPCIMLFSSGTTGYPKAVVHTMTYPLGHIVTARWWHHVERGGLHLTISDTGWGKALWGKLYGTWLCESAVFVYDFDRFNAADILGLFSKHRITTFCAPPTMYRFFIKEDLSRYDLSCIHHATVAGEALNPEVFNQFERATGLKLMEGFGQTESTLLVANLFGTTPRIGSMGRPSPQFAVGLVDADGKPVPPGEEGEIVVHCRRGEVCGIFDSYYGDKEATERAWRDGCYHTGDTAWRDEDGYFYYVGRNDDLIKSSGYRIGPFEVESVIMELSYVMECAVIGVPDPDRGQVVKAFVVLAPGVEASEEDLRRDIQNYVKDHTAPYKYPRQVSFITAMPKTPSGKIIRSELRKLE